MGPALRPLLGAAFVFGSLYVLAGTLVWLSLIISFHQPARMSFIPRLVPREDLSAVVAIGSVLFNGARFIGPAVAAGIITVFGVAPAFLFDAASYCVMIAALLAIRVAPPSREGKTRIRLFARYPKAAAATFAVPIALSYMTIVFASSMTFLMKMATP